MKYENISNILILDIGEEYLKGTIVQASWRGRWEVIQSVATKTKGIKKRCINNLLELTESIYSIIYQLEIDNHIKIESALIILSFIPIQYVKYVKELQIKSGVVSDSDLELLNKEEYSDNEYLGTIKSEYKVNNNYIDYPVNVECDHLFKHNYSIVAKGPTINQIRSIFIKLKIQILEISYNLVFYAINQQTSALHVDIGYNSSRVLINMSNKKHVFLLEYGAHDLYKNLWDLDAEPALFFGERYLEHVNITRDFFITLFEKIIRKTTEEINSDILYKCDIPVSITGGIAYLPGLELLLSEHFDRTFHVTSPGLDMKTDLNAGFFYNNYMALKYVNNFN